MPVPITETTGTDCLLVVDPSESEVKALASMLGKIGFEILPALTGAQGIQMLHQRRPDLILLDLHLPDMDGFELCRRVQENPQWAEIPIIFLSADKDKNLVARALESGGVDYIAKPFHKQELLSRVRTHLMLKTSRDYARRLAQDKDETLSMISHHLQNHLVGMQMSAQFLLERAHASTDPKLRLMAENIRSSSGQMRAFLKAFLANAAADHGLNLRMEPVSLTDAAGRAIRQYEDTANAKDLVLRSCFPGDAMPVRADASALSQVLDNLISNAVKFSPQGREIQITVRNAQGKVEFHIQDQGAGFTAEDKARMFHRYARLSAQPTGGEPSTGLGLSIVKKLLDAMNGELICESTPGKGTTFIVRLPAAGERPSLPVGKNLFADLPAAAMAPQAPRPLGNLSV
ncbi:MAG: response regulator receiver sensor signal transduction histidine kinase [Pedosphaera sp.]|nr:response regulator receiver sensor signal transduction histidine kinase [Pedosphaera sp.]